VKEEEVKKEEEPVVAPEPEKAESEAEEPPLQDNWNPKAGSKLTFSFQDGLIVQVLPNGDVLQTGIENNQSSIKTGGTLQDAVPSSEKEVQRVITRQG